MATKIRLLFGAVIVLALVFNMTGCAQTETVQTGTFQKGAAQTGTTAQQGAYQQGQKMLWSVNPKGAGQNTDMGIYIDEEGAGP